MNSEKKYSQAARSARKRAERLLHAEQLFAEKRYVETSKACQALLRIDPHHLGGWELRVKALWKLGEYETLLCALDCVLTLNPTEPGYHSLRAATLECVGRYGEAVQSYARASALQSEGDRSAHQAMADLREWQSVLVADLIREDTVFSASYAQDPHAACSTRGFDFLPEFAVVESWVQDPSLSVSYPKPS